MGSHEALGRERALIDKLDAFLRPEVGSIVGLRSIVMRKPDGSSLIIVATVNRRGEVSLEIR